MRSRCGLSHGNGVYVVMGRMIAYDLGTRMYLESTSRVTFVFRDIGGRFMIPIYPLAPTHQEMLDGESSKNQNTQPEEETVEPASWRSSCPHYKADLKISNDEETYPLHLLPARRGGSPAQLYRENSRGKLGTAGQRGYPTFPSPAPSG